MLLIPCPYCGPRDQVEFSYGGDATAERPADPLRVPPQEWDDYVYLRDNPRGPHEELWQHHAGCRAWLRVMRDTLTHEISAARPARPR
jgi:methylglutamate dehydrogenase subunit B